MLIEQTNQTDEQNGKVEEPSVSQDHETEEKDQSVDVNQPEDSPEILFQSEDDSDESPLKEVIVDIADLEQEDEYTSEERTEWESRYAETMRIFRSGELVSGKLIAINESDVAVDIGFKSEGSIPLGEFDHPNELKIGDEIEVCIDRIEDSDGTLVLSKKKAEFYRVWEKINDLYQTGKMIEAPITRRIKGGMVVDMFGIEAFLPGSQIDVHPVRDFDALVGATMDFRIIKVNNARKNVVLSHKVLVEESLREIREKVLSELEENQVVEGVVKNITDFGVFVDLGGVDGLLHITDLSWGRVSHPSDVVKLDEKITVKVLHYDKERQRISLGLKQLKEHHWEEIEKKYPIGGKFKGKVVSIVKYGAFIELESGVEGLVHISEMSWTQHIKHPSQMVNVADEIDIVILNIDRENRKISLGMKQVEEDPWERLEQVFLPNTRHKGAVRDLVPFGAFVELQPGIDGLIHISDLSWTRKVRHPGEIVKKGQEIEVVILNFDKNERRIALGFKQLEDDPWDSFEREYPIRSRTEGSVIRVLEKGVVVMLPLGVEGFIPNSQLGKTITGDNKKKIKEGDNLELEVIEFDKPNHRIVLSHSVIERSKERSVYRVYKESAAEKTTIGDIMRETSQVDEKEPARKKAMKEVKPAAAEEEVKPDKVEEPEAKAHEEPTEVVTEPEAVEEAVKAAVEPAKESVELAEAPADIIEKEPETVEVAEVVPEVEPEKETEVKVEEKPVIEEETDLKEKAVSDLSEEGIAESAEEKPTEKTEKPLKTPKAKKAKTTKKAEKVLDDKTDEEVESTEVKDKTEVDKEKPPVKKAVKSKAKTGTAKKTSVRSKAASTKGKVEDKELDEGEKTRDAEVEIKEEKETQKEAPAKTEKAKTAKDKTVKADKKSGSRSSKAKKVKESTNVETGQIDSGINPDSTDETDTEAKTAKKTDSKE